MTNRDRILEALGSSVEPLNDDELARRAGISPRQTVNMLCRAMEAEGVLRRFRGADGKIVNQVVSGDLPAVPLQAPPEPKRPPVRADGLAMEPLTSVPSDPASGDSQVQRLAEGHMLVALGKRLGLSLAPRRIFHPSGARVEIDGADDNLTVLVECWAHQGSAKVAQKYKLVVDATKLSWIAKSLDPRPDRLILCVSDPAAVGHLSGVSWHAQAIREMGVEIEIVNLDPSLVSALNAAQKRQYR
ncbi:MAG: hypothetical protein QM779_02840 [Propionicimonas sp.]|uniref:hypothetical protein n=1 Tax=Propionicimonas sp. TaxID=1955623 RepID=UPI003D0BBA4B